MWTFYLVYSRDFCLRRHDFDLHFRLSYIHSSTLINILAKSPRLHCARMEPSIRSQLWEDQTNTLDQPSRKKLDAPIRLFDKAKRLANQLLSDVMNTLACVYCYFLHAELNGYSTSYSAGQLLTAAE